MQIAITLTSKGVRVIAIILIHMTKFPVMVLIHSPLVGPYTWFLAAEAMRRRGVEAIVPVLKSPVRDGWRYWEIHVESVAASLNSLGQKTPVVLIAHSGAGPLLPAVREYIGQPVVGYLFVDAMLPENGKSRLDLFGDPDAAAQFRNAAKNGLLPPWNDEDLREAIPDDQVRARFVRNLSPLPLAVYEEPIPVFDGWPDAPSGYLRFGSNPAYETHSRNAIQEGFAYIRLEGGHFHMLVEPEEVVWTLLELLQQMLDKGSGEDHPEI
jgi:hypothetical protein